ncbi:MAG: aldehyde ferredoxin oxidoreductase family protein [Dethiobacter sp.]|jgi:aldehyde:ferredoxin oxidoreductase|nr:aldehyde ferredoxin oxidoreductase family protein [Dethiobacter sp.]
MSYFGRLLRIDLSSNTSKDEEISKNLLQQFLGGKGLGAWFLYKEVPAGCNPLSEENKLIFALGALSGTMAPAASKYHLLTKSPLTGIFLDSNSGGHFGPELKACGYDVFIIEGKAPKPVIIFIDNGRVNFLPADDYWGLGIYDTEEKIRESLGDKRIRVASIGIAGENLVKFACIGNDYSRHAGRGGAGAVMGSKNLKAIAVRGNHNVEVVHPFEFIQAVSEANSWIKDNPWVKSKRRWGTAGSAQLMNEQGVWPVNNFSQTSFQQFEKIGHEVFDHGLVKRLSCANCSVSCSKGYRDTTFTGGEIEGPEFETICLLGANVGLDDPQAIAAANYLCNNFGLDTISAGVVIGMVIDALDKGIISRKVVGLSENKNRVEMVLWLLEQIANRCGFGNIMAEGVRDFAGQFGLESLAPHVKGLELPAYDPRASFGIGLAYQTSDRGGCHLRSWPTGREITGILSPGNSIDGKAEFVSGQQHEKAAQECFGVCQFPYGIGFLSNSLVNLLNAAIGSNHDNSSLIKVGERVWNLARCFNNREGITRADDLLPAKFADEPLPDGRFKGTRLTYELQNRMLDEYYQLNGWSSEGIPCRKKLEELGLDEMASDLWGESQV